MLDQVDVRIDYRELAVGGAPKEMARTIPARTETVETPSRRLL